MKTYIAILRGINVSGQKKIKMADLREKLKKLDFQNIKTYIQSGNVLFDHKNEDKIKLATKISKLIKDEFGFEVPVIVIDSVDIKKILNNNPFLNDGRKEDESRLYVTVLKEEPGIEQLKGMASYAFPPEEFAIKDNVVYLFSPKGYGNAKLNNNFFENKLKVTATTRNWKTMNKLAKMVEK